MLCYNGCSYVYALVLNSLAMSAVAQKSPVPNFHCPDTHSYNKVSGQCENTTSLYADFPRAARELCDARGGGNACYNRDEWSKKLARWVQGNAPCFPRAQVNPATGYCEDAKKIYGPFLKSDMKACLEHHASQVCEKGGWPKDILGSRKLLPFAGIKGKAWGLHEVTSHPLPDDGSAVSPKQLSSFIARARRQGCEFVDAKTFLTEPARNQVLLTFDDGYIGNYDEAAPVLSQQKVPAVFFVHPFFVGKDLEPYGYMSWAQLEQLSDNPLFTIGSHSYTHRDLTAQDEVELRSDFAFSQDAIRHKVGQKPILLAYPMGRSNAAVRKVAGENHQFSFAYGQANYGSLTDRTALTRHPLNGKRIGQVKACH